MGSSQSVSHKQFPHRSDSFASMSSSTCSSTSITQRFVSYESENDMIRIKADNNNNCNQTWSIRIVPKYDGYVDGGELDDSLKQSSLMVFGVCDSSLIELGYKHKYYAIGYCRTYCHGYQFYSYCAAFPICSVIKIKYDKSKRQITFWCNDVMKDRKINIEHHPVNDYVITIKAYDDQFAIQISS